MTSTINLPSARAMLASAEQHFEESETTASSDGRIRSTDRASVMATMAVARAIIELTDRLLPPVEVARPENAIET